jgi:predicted DNA-binding antitoxin AbrB/MazE fold protein
MSITIDATYEDGVLKPAQPLPLSEHEKVRVTVESQVRAAAGAPGDSAGNDSAELSIGEQIAAMARALPPGALDDLPDDLASEHDHYLYGSPKRSE